MRQRIIGKGIDAAKVTLFPPRADSALYTLRQRTSGEAFRKKYGLQGKLIVSHSGNMGVKQGLEVILAVAELSRDRDDIRYLFVGDGAMRVQLEFEARARSLHNVLFLPVLESSEFLEMLAATDIALITQQRVVSDIVFPSKTVTLLSAGCPVIASVNSGSEVARVVSNSRAGVVVEAENSNALWNSISELAASPEALLNMSQQARHFAMECWDEHRTLPLMEAQLRDCVSHWRARQAAVIAKN